MRASSQPLTVLVTASSAGIGRAIASRFHQDGHAVVVHGRTEGTAARAAAAIGSGVRSVWGDVTNPEDLQQLCADVADAELDVLVAAAGPYTERQLADTRADDWMHSFRANVVGAVEPARAALPGMRRRGFGRVVFLGTRGTRTPIPTMIDYSAAKAALANAMISMAHSDAAPGVTINMVSPGVILTPALQQMFADRSDNEAHRPWDEAGVVARYAPNPQQRLGRPEDISHAVAFLAGPDASYINGVDLPVDGGITGTH